MSDFVGSGSTLKQLSLARVSEVRARGATTAKVGEPAAEVVARAEQAGDAAVVVLDDRGRPVGWPWLRQLRGQRVRAGVP